MRNGSDDDRAAERRIRWGKTRARIRRREAWIALAMTGAIAAYVLVRTLLEMEGNEALFVWVLTAGVPVLVWWVFFTRRPADGRSPRKPTGRYHRRKKHEDASSKP